MQKIDLGNGNVALASRIISIDASLFQRVLRILPKRCTLKPRLEDLAIDKIVLYTADDSMYQSDVHNSYDPYAHTAYLHVDEKELKAASAKHPADINVFTRTVVLMEECYDYNKSNVTVSADRKALNELHTAFKEEKVKTMAIYSEFLDGVAAAITAA